MNNKLKKILPYTLAIFFLVLGMLSFGSSIEAQAKPPMLEVTQVIGPGNLNTITYKNVSASSILDIHERYDANFSNGFYCVSNCGYVDVLWPGEEFTITYNYDCPLGVCPVGPVTSTFEASPFGISVDDVAAYEVVVLVTLEAPVLTPVPPPTTAPAISITPFPVHVFDDVLADAGQTVDVKMTVTNIGDGAPLMGSITELTDYIGCVGVCEFSLGVGASSDFTITFAPEAGARPYANWIIVTSNAGDTATLFGGVGVKPNLTTDSIVITSGNEVEVGETIDFEATFTNVGQFDVDGAFKNHLSYRFGNSGNFTDMTGGRTTYEGVINQGESLSDQVSLLIPMTSPSPGNLWIRHCIDFDNNIDESNESDNCFETDFGPVIPQNDLAASTGSGNPVPNSITGVYDSISVLMNIHNFGNDLPSADPTVSGVSYVASIDLNNDGTVDQKSDIGRYSSGILMGENSNNLIRTLYNIPFGTHKVCSEINLEEPITFVEDPTVQGNNTDCIIIDLDPPEPEITITSSPHFIRQGGLADIIWTTNIDYPAVQCTVTGPNGVNVTFEAGLGYQDTVSSGQLSRSGTFVLKCIEPAGGTSFTKKVVVEIVPDYQQR